MNENKLSTEVADSSKEIEIDLRDLFEYLLQHWLPIVIVMILGAAIAFAYTMFLLTPKYTASSSIYVVSATANSALDLTDLNMGTSLTNDYKKLVTSRTMLENVLNDTGEEMTVRQLKSMLSVNNETGTRILEFSVTSVDPVQAMRLANSCAAQAILFLPEVMGVKDNIPSLIDGAILPTEPSNVSFTKNVAIGLLIGLVIVAGILIIRYMLNDTLSSAEDVEKFLGIMPMAVVPENGQKHRGSGYYYYYYDKGKHGGQK